MNSLQMENGRQMTGKTDDGPVMYVSRMAVFLNRWFATYDAARKSMDSEGGYLLPWDGQYVVTVADAIRELGLDPEDPDWKRIGRDWVRPDDIDAWERLRIRREVAM